MNAKILLVDDDVPLSKAISRTLAAAGYQPLTAYTAEDGLQVALTQQPDLILLDIMIPTSGGWEVCRRIRELHGTIPIIFLTALGNTENVVYGFEAGADDYIIKPFEEAELLARVKAQLRRAQNSAPAQRLVFGREEIVLDLRNRQVLVRGTAVDLTPREYELLVALATQAGRVIPSAELASRAWGMADSAGPDNLKPYIHYLRKKLELDPAAPRWIMTIRGVGYRFAEG